MIINPRLLSIYSITGETVTSLLMMTPLLQVKLRDHPKSTGIMNSLVFRLYFHPCISMSSIFVHLYLFIYLGFYFAFNTVQVISRWVVEGQRKPVHTVRQGSVL